MKKWGLIFGLLLIMILSACSNGPKWQVDLELAERDSEKKAFPLLVEVQENGTPVNDLMIICILEMEHMDHGKLQFEFEPQQDGKYIAYTAFPMGGDWVAKLGLSKGDQKMEKAISFKVPSE